MPYQRWLASGTEIDPATTTIDFADAVATKSGDVTTVTFGGSLDPLIIPAAAVPAQTAEGSIVWDSNDDLLTVGTGASRKTMVDTDSTQTLTNKTMTSPVINAPSSSATGNVIADPGNGGAIAVAVSGVCNLTSAGAETRTLAIPTFVGQEIALSCNVDGGDNVITVASAFDQAGNTTITLNDAGDFVLLKAVHIGGTRRWRLVVNDGATLA